METQTVTDNGNSSVKFDIDGPYSNQPLENHRVILEPEHSENFHKINEAWLKGEVSLDILGHMLQQGEIKPSEYLAIRYQEPIRSSLLPNNLDGSIPHI
jgi:hypothetical protein